MRISKKTKHSPGSSWAHAWCISFTTVLRRAAPSASSTSQSQRRSGAVSVANWSSVIILGGVIARPASAVQKHNLVPIALIAWSLGSGQIPTKSLKHLRIWRSASSRADTRPSLGPVLISRIKTGASLQNTWYSTRKSMDSRDFAIEWVCGPTVNRLSGGKRILRSLFYGA